MSHGGLTSPLESTKKKSRELAPINTNRQPAVRKSLFAENISPTANPLETCSSQEDATLYVYTTFQHSGTRRQSISPEFCKLVQALITGNYESIAKAICQKEKLHDAFVQFHHVKIRNEIWDLCSKGESSHLRLTDLSTLNCFSWNQIANEIRDHAPTLWGFICASTENPSNYRNKVKKGLALLLEQASAACSIIHTFNRDLNLMQHINSIILLRGGAKKSVFRRYAAVGHCMSYPAVLEKADSISKHWEITLSEWKEMVGKERQCEVKLVDHTSVLKKESEDRESSRLALHQLLQELELLRHVSHPGYFFAGDNVDLRTHARYTSMNYRDRDEHLFQLNAYMNRVYDNSLEFRYAPCSPNEVNFSELLPSQRDRDKLIQNLAVLVAKIWAEYIPAFSSYGDNLPKFISHKYMDQTKQCSKKVNMGVLRKNEQYQMVNILDYTHEYVACHGTESPGPVTVPMIGDNLTVERGLEGLSSQRNGRTSTKRLEGLVMSLTEFHNQAELIKVIWHHLYQKQSGACIGTLVHAKGYLGATNVQEVDPQKAYYQSAALLDKYTSAYIIAGAMSHFELIKLDSEPTCNTYNVADSSGQSKSDYLILQAKKYVDSVFILTVPDTQMCAPRSNKYVCVYCSKPYKRPSALRKHEHIVHNHQDPKYANMQAPPVTTEQGGVFIYTRKALTLLLLRREHNDALHMGDGERE